MEWVSFGETLSFRVEAFRFAFGTGPRAFGLIMPFRPAFAFPFGLSLSFRFLLTLVAAFTLSLRVGRWCDQGARLSFLQIIPCALDSRRGGGGFTLVARFASFALP